MIISDKSAVNWPRCRNAPQSASAVYKNAVTNKSVPRTRKEKCQTRRSRCRGGEGRCRSQARPVGFRLAFTPVSLLHSGRAQPSCLTFLTPARQNCQKTEHGSSCKIYPLRLCLTFLTGCCQKCQTRQDSNPRSFSNRHPCPCRGPPAHHRTITPLLDPPECPGGRYVSIGFQI
jgi:hypothetical protein